MSGHDKTKVMEKWCGGEIKVMVCTSAFGMGVNEPDIDIVIHIGVNDRSMQSFESKLAGTCTSVIVYITVSLILGLS